MLNYVKKDITTATTGIVAHGVNCQGKMGSGVAFFIRRRWPQAYQEYMTYCRLFDNNRQSMLGMVQTVDVGNEIMPLIVANCFTQLYYGYDGKQYADVSAVREALYNISAYADTYNLPIYLPKIGCGLGGLSFDQDVQPILEKIEQEYPNIEINVCEK